MASINKVFIMGNLTRDPDFRNTPNGSPVCKMTVASSRKNRNTEETCFVDVTVWGKPAENCRQYLSKGSSVFVEGYLKLETWEDRNGGGKRSKLSMVAENVQFMSSNKRDNNNYSAGNSGYNQYDRYANQQQPTTSYEERANYAPQPAMPTQHDIDKANGYQPQPEEMAENDIPF